MSYYENLIIDNVISIMTSRFGTKSKRGCVAFHWGNLIHELQCKKKLITCFVLLDKLNTAVSIY